MSASSFSSPSMIGFSTAAAGAGARGAAEALGEHAMRSTLRMVLPIDEDVRMGPRRSRAQTLSQRSVSRTGRAPDDVASAAAEPRTNAFGARIEAGVAQVGREAAVVVRRPDGEHAAWKEGAAGA